MGYRPGHCHQGGPRMEMSPISTRILAGLLEERTGQQLAATRRWRLNTALMPLMQEHGIATLDELALRIASGREPKLAEAAVEALLNNETFFFRDAAAFQLLWENAVPHLAEARARNRRLRILCVGCSTGQEAYSIAMTIADEPERWAGWSIDIVGTDISRAAIARAREGVYSQFEVQRGLPIRRLMSWFEPEGERWRVHPALRQRIEFHVANLLDPLAFGGKFDIVLCRNVLLYFSSEVRGSAFERLAGTLAPDGLLMLGAGETVIGQTDAFISDPERRGLYRLASASQSGLAATA